MVMTVSAEPQPDSRFAASRQHAPIDGASVPALREFWRGLTQPSGLSVAAACVVAAAAFGFCANFVTADWMARHGDLFAWGTDDVHAAVTQKALSLAMPTSGHPRILLLGDLASDVNVSAELASAAVAKAGEQKARMIDLRTPDQTLWETLSIVDQTRRGFEGGAVLVLCHSALEAGPDVLRELDRHPRIGLHSPSVFLELHRAKITSSPLRQNYFVDNHNYLLARAPAAMMNLSSQVTGRTRASAIAGRHTESETRLGGGRRHDSHLDTNLATLDRLVERLQQRQWLRSALVAPPRKAGDDLLRRRLKEIATRRGILLFEATDATSSRLGVLPQAIDAVSGSLREGS